MDNKRKNLLNSLNNKKNRLINQGANASEVYEFFKNNKRTLTFRDLSTAELEILYKQTKQRVKISKFGNIQPVDYLNKLKAKGVHVENYNASLQKIKQTTLYNRDVTLSHIKWEEKQKKLKLKQNYIGELQKFGLEKQYLDKLKKLTPKQLEVFIDKGKGELDYSNIFFDSNRQDEYETQQTREEKKKIVEDIKRNINNYYNAIKRIWSDKAKKVKKVKKKIKKR